MAKPYLSDFSTIVDQFLGDDTDGVYTNLEDGDFKLFVKIYEEELNNITEMKYKKWCKKMTYEVNLILNISLQSIENTTIDDLHQYIIHVVYNHIIQDCEYNKIFKKEDELDNLGIVN